MSAAADCLRSLGPEVANSEAAGPQAIDSWSDARLLAAAVEVLTPPKLTVDSFTLHAPLELLARGALLARVSPDARLPARRRIAALAAAYAQAGGEVRAEVRSFGTPEAGWAALRGAFADRDPDGADAALCSLLGQLPTEALREGLVAEVLDRTGAAAHAPILLAELPRWLGRLPEVGLLLRAPLRTLVKQGDARLRWHRRERARTPASGLEARLLAVPRIQPSSFLIVPMLSSVEESGCMAEQLDDVTVSLSPRRAENCLLRVAAWSMLQDTAQHAAYGWTHCLTLPRAVLQLSEVSRDARAAVAVAASIVFAFRAVFGEVTLDPEWAPAPSGSRALAGVEPAAAAAAAWHALPEERPLVAEVLATRAARHADAHYVKYTLACLDAADVEPASAPLYLASAAYLGAWWEEHDRQS